MRRTLLLLAIALALALPVQAQVLATGAIINTSDTVTSNVIGPSVGVSFQITGTYVGTLTFQASADCSTFVSLLVTSSTDGSLVTTATSTGIWSAGNAGYLCMRVFGTAMTSGRATVTILRGYGSAKVGSPIENILAANTLCMSATTQDSYWQEVAANDPGLFTGGTACAGGTVRLDVTSARALFAVPVQGPYGTAAAPGLAIDSNTGWYGSAGIGRFSCGNVANCMVIVNGSASVNGNFNVSQIQALSLTNQVGVLSLSTTAPTISGFGGTGAAIIAGSSAIAWRVNVGTVAPGTTGTINLPTATTGWNCWVTDQTTPLDITRQTSSGTASVGITTTIAWTASDILVGGCAAF